MTADPTETATRRVIYSILISLDGYIAGPNGELDWHLIDEEFHTFVNDQQREIDTYLFGRRMYETMSAWDTLGDDSSLPEYELEFARLWNDKLKIVFSTTMDSVRGNSRLAGGDISEEIAKLKARPGKDVAIGGAALAAAAMERDLIDEYRLFVQPVILGGGTLCFTKLEHSIALQPVETFTFGSGVVYLRYQREAATDCSVSD
jgi:dihydrofolate reductase